MNTQVDARPERAHSEQYAAILEQFDRKMEHTADAAVAFAPPQEFGNLTVIPVAKVRWGIGSGTRTGKLKEQDGAQEGKESGQIVSVSPVGYIEVKEGTTTFRPFFTPDTILKMQVVGGLIAIAILRGINTAFGHLQTKRGERKRESVFNVIFSPGANIIERQGRTRKPRQGFRLSRRLNERKPKTPLPAEYPEKEKPQKVNWQHVRRTVLLR